VYKVLGADTRDPSSFKAYRHVVLGFSAANLRMSIVKVKTERLSLEFLSLTSPQREVFDFVYRSSRLWFLFDKIRFLNLFLK
jgi:hypothetical protein